MGEDSGSESGSDSSNNPSPSSDGGASTEALAANKTREATGEVYQAANSAQKPGNGNTKEATGTGSGISQKSGDKNPSGGNEVPSVDEVSIPSSVDPDAPTNTEGNTSDDSSSSDSSE